MENMYFFHFSSISNLPHLIRMDQEPQAKGTPKYDDVFKYVNSFGRYQKALWFCMHLLVLPSSAQFLALVFAMGTPQFFCVTPNVTCPTQQCCDNCTAYEFDGPMITTVIEVAAGMGSAYVNCLSFFAFLRLLVGIGLTCAMISMYIYVMELVGPSKRTFSGTINNFFWAFYSLVNLLFAYLVPYWRHLLILYTAPGILFLPFWRLVPESPRWLVAHGHLDEAQTAIIKYGGRNGKAINEAELRAVIEDVRKAQLQEEEKAKRSTPVDLLKTRKLRKFSLLLCYQWFENALGNFGVFIFVSQLAGNVYLNYCVMRAILMVRYVFNWPMYLTFGRRMVHGVMSLTGGALLLAMIGVYQDHPLLTTGLAVIAYVAANEWCFVYIVTAELFPTVLRNTAIGTGSACARVGAILSPYIAMMAQLPGLSLVFPSIIFGVVALVMGVLTYWIPETLFVKMHQTIEEAEAAEDHYGIVCCGKPLRKEEVDTPEEGNITGISWMDGEDGRKV